MMWKLSHCPLASLRSLKEKKSRQSTDIDYICDNVEAKTRRVFIETGHNLCWIHQQRCTLKPKIHILICLWIRALNADRLTVPLVPCLSFTHTQHGIHGLIYCVTICKAIFKENVNCRQIAKNRHIATPTISSMQTPRNDSCLIWKGICQKLQAVKEF